MALIPNRSCRLPKNFSFWRNDVPKIKIFNAEDFPKDAILNELGIIESPLAEGFGNTNTEEAKARIEVIKFIHHNPKIINLLDELSKVLKIPNSQKDFQTYYDPKRKHNPFWAKLHPLINFLKKKESELPSRLKTFYNVLKNFESLEPQEKLMAKIIAERLENTAVIEGLATVTVSSVSTTKKNIESGIKETKWKIHSFNLTLEELHGHRTFSHSLSDIRKKQYPKWLQNNNWPAKLFGNNIGKLIKRFVDYYNNKLERDAKKIMVIEGYSPEVETDLNKAIYNYLNVNRKTILPLLNTYVNFLVYFSYGRSTELGINDDNVTLRFQIYDATLVNNKRIEFNFSYTDFTGYSPERMALIKKARRLITEVASHNAWDMNNASFRDKIINIYPNFFSTDVIALSPEIDKKHKWHALYNLYNDKSVVKVYMALRDLQNFIRINIYTLKEMNTILHSIVAKAKELKTSICFPVILDQQENMISFKKLYPLHLGQILKAKKIVPIDNLPAINGSIIGLTGRHGGGKTVTEHTIAGNVYLAQSGLPILGEKFHLNPKTHMGMVFIEGIVGQSVVQVLLRKINNIFKGIYKVPGGNILLVLDELGSATQQEDGMDLAMDILEAVYRRKISLIFSTQILNVAEQAEKRFNTKCFKVDAKHHLQPGIAGGDLKALIKKSKLKKYLK